MLHKLKNRVFRPLDAAALGYLRIVFGGLMIFESGYYLYHWSQLADSQFFFSHAGFAWLPVLPHPGMYILGGIMALAAVLVTLGLWFRPAVAVLFVLGSWFFLLDVQHYNNHHYLYNLFAFLFIFTRADEYRSLRNLRNPARREQCALVPAWQIGLFQFQLVVVYFFGALAKWNYDWLNGYAMKLWLPGRELAFAQETMGPVVSSDFFINLTTYGGMGFDAIAGWCLLHRRLRWVILPPLILFHLMNAYVWSIGSFPWVMLLVTPLFFREYIRKGENWFARKFESGPRPQLPDSARGRRNQPPGVLARVEQAFRRPRQKLVITGIALYVAVQLLLPFRHYLYPGDVNFTGEGHYFAWRMMLVSAMMPVKLSYYNEATQKWQPIPLEDYINQRQLRKSKRVPANYIRFAKWFAEEELRKKRGYANPRVRARIPKSVNARRYFPVFSYQADLNRYTYHWFWPNRHFEAYDPSAEMGVSYGPGH